MPVPRATFDLRDPAFVADPYAALARAREQAPVLWHEGLGLWVTTTHAAANDVLRDRRLGRILRPRSSGDDGWTTFDWLHADSILDSEPPKHTRLRRLVAGAFARGHVARLRPRVEEMAAGLLDEVERVLERDGRVDVIATYAEPLPVLVICELLGAPTADWKLLRDWSQAIVRMYEVDPDEHAQRDAQRACEEFAAYVERLAAERAEAPGDDLLTSLVQERDGGDRLSPRELVATVVLLLNAGHEASVNGFGNGLASLLADRAQTRGRAARRWTSRPPSSGSSRRCCGTTHRCTSSSAPRRPTSSSTASRSAAARRSPPCSGPPTATPPSSPSPTASWPTATRTRTSPSAPASTSASGRRWPGWSCRSRPGHCSNDSDRSRSSTPPAGRRSCCAGYERLVVARRLPS